MKLFRLPYLQQARDAAEALLKKYGMLVVYSEDASVGGLTSLFGGYDTGLDFIYTWPCSQEEWDRQAKFLNERGAKSPPYNDSHPKCWWVLLHVNLHGHTRQELVRDMPNL